MTSYNTLYALDSELHSLHSAPPSPTTPALPIVHHDPPPFDLPSSRASSVSAGPKILAGVARERLREVRVEEPVESGGTDDVGREGDSKLLDQMTAVRSLFLLLSGMH
jgi:hypothetical protein